MTIEASARAELTPPREEARNFSGAANLWKYRKQRFKDGDEDGSPTRRFIQRFVVGILPKHSDFACFPLPLFYELFIYVGYFFKSITSFDSFSLSRVLALGQLLHEHRRNWRAGDKTRRWKAKEVDQRSVHRLYRDKWIHRLEDREGEKKSWWNWSVICAKFVNKNVMQILWIDASGISRDTVFVEAVKFHSGRKFHVQSPIVRRVVGYRSN